MTRRGGLFRGAVTAALAGAVLPTPAQAEQTAFSPGGGWTANFADDFCALERTFAHDGDTVQLRLQQFVPGSMFEITMGSDALAVRDRARSITFAAAGEAQTIPFYSTFEAANGLEGAVFGATLSDGPAPAGSDYAVYATGKTVERLTLSDAFADDIALLTGSLEHPLKVMESCLDDLLTRWGLDPQAHRTLSRKAAPTGSEEWLKVTAPMQRDFLRKGSNRQDVRLIVDAQGKITGCRVLQWPADEPIAQRLCDAVQSEAEIPPALDSAGNPVPSYYLLSLAAVARAEFSRSP